MRVCPSCGYKDFLEWKNLPHQLYHEYMILEDFERLYPELAKQLKEKVKLKQRGNMVDGKDGHGYHLVKAGYVHRVPIQLCPNGRWFSGSSIYENPNRVKNQTKLDFTLGKEK